MKMGNKAAKILDECLARINEGESVESCLASYPKMRDEISPSLQLAQSVSSIPKISPSERFRTVTPYSLMARIQPGTSQKNVAELEPSVSLADQMAMAGQRLWQAIIGAKKVAIPLTLALLLVVGLGAANYMSPAPALASECTLSILSGSVEIQNPGADARQAGADGMVLAEGTRIRTAPDSHALLTFFDGSTIKLEPDTEIEIRQMETDGEQAVNIVIKQWLGRTWSRVVKMAGPGSHYEIETPSACAIVRGTLFTTEVDANGETTVTTTEGLVSVLAQDEEVYLPPDQQTTVEAGEAPSEPYASPEPPTEIIINFDTPVVGSVTDPTGASTGNLPDGLYFNQIPGSQVSTNEGMQTITIPRPVSGEYSIVMRFINNEAAHFNIKGISDHQTAFNYADDCAGESQSTWCLRLNLQVNNNLITGSKISKIEPVLGGTPEKIVRAKLSKDSGDMVAQPPSHIERGQSARDNAKDHGNNQNQATTDDQGTADSQSISDDSDNASDPASATDNSDTKDKDKDKDNGNSSDNGNANGNSNSSDNGNANGNSNSSDNGNANGNSNSSDNGNANGNSNSSDNGNANANGNSNSSDNGNANGNSNSSDNGDGNANGNSNSSDNGDGNGNSNSSDSSNSNGQGNAYGHDKEKDKKDK
jgi:hypothetical protein